MQGSIAFDGTLSGSIAGGGGGGSEVTITPVLTEGEKIADFEIDGIQGELYAPTPTPLPEHIVNDIYGFNYTPYPSTEIARYTIDDGVEQSIYAPDYETTWEAYPGVTQDYTIGLLKCYGSTYEVKIPYYQKQLTAGTNITINPVTNVISAAPLPDYSTTIYKTGRKWIDGSDVYEIVLRDHTSLENTTGKLINVSSLNIKEVINCNAALIDNWQGAYTYTQPFYNGTIYFCVYYVDQLNIQLNYSSTVGNGRGHDGYQIILECTLN